MNQEIGAKKEEVKGTLFPCSDQLFSLFGNRGRLGIPRYGKVQGNPPIIPPLTFFLIDQITLFISLFFLFPNNFHPLIYISVFKYFLVYSSIYKPIIYKFKITHIHNLLKNKFFSSANICLNCASFTFIIGNIYLNYLIV